MRGKKRDSHNRYITMRGDINLVTVSYGGIPRSVRLIIRRYTCVLTRCSMVYPKVLKGYPIEVLISR